MLVSADPRRPAVSSAASLDRRDPAHRRRPDAAPPAARRAARRRRRAARARAASRGGSCGSGCDRSSRWARPPARSRPATSPAASSPPTSAPRSGRLGLALNSMLGQIEVAFAERTASEARLRRFVADASHELRTPLTSIRGYAELFRRGASTRPDDLAKTMLRIEEAARAHGRARRRPAAARPTRPGPSARTRAGRPHPPGRAPPSTTCAPSRRTGRSTYASNGAVVVTGDEHRLRQVVANLLENARTHTPPDDAGRRARRRAATTTRSSRSRDHGPGMTTEDAARAFERFWRADPSRTRDERRRRSRARDRRRDHRRRTAAAPRCRPRPGAGATFRVLAPPVPARRPPASTPARPSRRDRAPDPRVRVCSPRSQTRDE